MGALPRLSAGSPYSPVIDDVAHELYGYLAPDLEGYDEALAQKIWPVLPKPSPFKIVSSRCFSISRTTTGPT
jgi:hypothetical protein